MAVIFRGMGWVVSFFLAWRGLRWGGDGSYFGGMGCGGVVAQRIDRGVLLSYSCDQICVQMCEILVKK